ncbi:hypothetical protein Q5P01_006616 [Channa striata]|uniref:Uncharacterized protein n=1 Tax=Channa striata TaxID=64152 RepID=A0AA88T4K3_CHASR|nr:hypothetical protein Q5P01_006616 [Channa striata]
MHHLVAFFHFSHCFGVTYDVNGRNLCPGGCVKIRRHFVNPWGKKILIRGCSGIWRIPAPQPLGPRSNSEAQARIHRAGLDGRDTLVQRVPKIQALPVGRAFWTVGRMKGGSCTKPSWAVAALFIPVSLLMLTSRGASSSKKMTQTFMAGATATSAGPGSSLTDDLLSLQAVADFFASEHAHVWLLSLVGSVAVGLSGIFPLLVIPIEAGAALKTEAGCQKLKQLLSFAIGGLLGDVFFTSFLRHGRSHVLQVNKTTT